MAIGGGVVGCLGFPDQRVLHLQGADPAADRQA